MNKTEEKKFKMSIQLSVLEDLGINLYSNVPAVISETVANSWDADAHKVEIITDTKRKEIIIKDDGHGMDYMDVNEKFLNVGYKRREAGNDKTPEGRDVMGRKGIGKLSLFSIAKTIEIRTIKKDEYGKIIDKNALLMEEEGIKKACKEKKDYYPIKLNEQEIDFSGGTQILLKNLKKAIYPDDNLRKRLARRFSVINPKFKFSVAVNNVEISVNDRDFYNTINYLWIIGDDEKDYSGLCSNVIQDRCIKIDGLIPGEENYTVSGWIGTVAEHKQISEDNNSVIITARGKLIHEDILKDIKEGGLFTKYVIGEIEANFLDVNNLDDMVTSDRQNLKEDDKRFVLLKEYIQKIILSEIKKNWEKWRREDGTVKALENPVVKQWFDRLKGDKRDYAKKLFGTINSIKVDKEDDRKELYKHGILAFEKLILKDLLTAVDGIDSEKDFSLLKSLFNGVDELEATHYYYITKGRLEIIQKFIDLSPNVKEKMIQEYLFNHLWLLDVAWERASDSAHMEQTIAKKFKAKETLTAEEKKARYDIAYKTYAGKHVLIELKKYGSTPVIGSLITQVSKYKNTLEKCLRENFPNEHSFDVEIICILEKPPKPVDQHEDHKKALSAYNARFITYEELIKQTKKNYQDYLDKQKEVSELQKLIESI